MSKVELGESELSESNTSLSSNSSQLFENVDTGSLMETDFSPIAFKASQKLHYSNNSRSSSENTSQEELSDESIELASELSPNSSGLYVRELRSRSISLSPPKENPVRMPRNTSENTSQEVLSDESIELASELSPNSSGLYVRELRSRSISLSPPKENPVRMPRRSIIPDKNQPNSKGEKNARLNVKQLRDIFEPIAEIEEDDILNQRHMSNANCNANSNNVSSFYQCAGSSNPTNSQSTNAVENRLSPTHNNEVNLIAVEQDKVQANGSNSTEEHNYLRNNEDNLSDLTMNGSAINQNIEFNLSGIDQAEANYSDQMLAKCSNDSTFNQCAGSSNPINSSQSTNAVENRLSPTRNNEANLIAVEQDKVQANGSNSTEEHNYLRNNEDNLSDVTMNGSAINQNIEFNLSGIDQAEANYSDQMLANCSNDSTFNQCAGSSNPINSSQSTNAVENRLSPIRNNEVNLIAVEQDKVQANGSNSTEEHNYLRNNEDNLSDVTMNGSAINQNIEFNLSGIDQAEANYCDQMLAGVSVINITNKQFSDISKSFHGGINSKKSLVLQIFRSSKGGEKTNTPLKVVIPCDVHNLESISISFSNTEVVNTNIDQSTQTETQTICQISNQSEIEVELLKPSTSRDGNKKSTSIKTKNLKLLKKSNCNYKNRNKSVSKMKPNSSVKINIPKKTINVNQQKKPKRAACNRSKNKNQPEKQIKTKTSSTAKQRVCHSHAHSRCCHYDSGSSTESGSDTEDSYNYSDSETSSPSYHQHCDCSDCVESSSSSCHCQSSSYSSSSTDWSDYEQSNSICHNHSRH